MKKKKILLVDDEEHFCRMVKLNLEETGKYEVMTLLSAKEIVPQINKFKPDVILLDLLMPKIDGFKALEMIENDPFAITIPIIVISALNRDADKVRAYHLGVNDYLTKPVELNSIIAAIEKVLR